MKVKQDSFHPHFADGVRSDEGDWEVRLLISQIVQKILGRENHFDNLKLLSQMV